MQKHAKLLFTIAAIFNFAVGLSLLFAWPLVQEIMQLAPSTGSNQLIMHIAAVLVLAFGYAYFMASRDPVTYRPYITLGAIGKLLVFATALPVLLQVGEGFAIALLAVGDFFFALAFIHFLRRYPTR